MLRPLRDKILVKPETRVKSSIIDVVMDEVDNTGVVVAVGPGHHTEDGRFIPQQVKVGERIRFGTSGYTKDDEYLKFQEYIEDDVRYLLMSWQDVCFVVPE